MSNVTNIVLTDKQMEDLFFDLQRKLDAKNVKLEIASLQNAGEIPDGIDASKLAEEVVDEYRKGLDNDQGRREQEIACAHAAILNKLPKEQEYFVSVKIDGRLDVRVKAKSFAEAKEKAEQDAGSYDWNAIELVNILAVNAEDKAGKFVDY